jgi:hypothetical protein
MFINASSIVVKGVCLIKEIEHSKSEHAKKVECVRLIQLQFKREGDK